MKIRKQADQHVAYDPKKIVWTPEQEALMTELAERLRRKQEVTGPVELNAESMTEAFLEIIQMRREKKEKESNG